MVQAARFLFDPHLLCGHAATEESCSGQVASMAWIRGTHHVLSIKHLPQFKAILGGSSHLVSLSHHLHHFYRTNVWYILPIYCL